MLTEMPRASRSAPKEADEIPLPSDETTPPVTKMKRVILQIPSTKKAPSINPVESAKRGKDGMKFYPSRATASI